jgi:hypothetical protein
MYAGYCLVKLIPYPGSYEKYLSTGHPNWIHEDRADGQSFSDAKNDYT